MGLFQNCAPGRRATIDDWAVLLDLAVGLARERDCLGVLLD
jgi:hypothetical protein